MAVFEQLPARARPAYSGVLVKAGQAPARTTTGPARLKESVFDADQFLDALERVAGGGTAMDPAVIAKLLSTGTPNRLRRRTGLWPSAGRESGRPSSSTAAGAEWYAAQLQGYAGLFDGVGMPDPSYDETVRALVAGEDRVGGWWVSGGRFLSVNLIACSPHRVRPEYACPLR